MTDYNELREAMVAKIAARGIDDEALLAAFRAVPREDFVPEAYRSHAYDDGPLPIGAAQTISQPYIVALMIAHAAVEPASRVLEVGAGSGYAAALLGHLAAEVVALERVAPLADQARARIAALGIGNVRVVTGDGCNGWVEGAPYDAILVAAAARSVPRALLEQLRCPGGRLVIPVERFGGAQRLVRIERRGHKDFATADLGGVRFVPLISDS
ncbi:protein-L-isoaspartate(D-aspartate) O-methyltransferase [Sphingomonas xanthus]|uniref:Protein-L-isoaspartate O-methyltransferase n=1 Tax=Sphingomonas xanthus TaxID=2594473 RepID=A0A516IPX1_9SPHN|nr:protein-L-isoaspartate(D-aspartate) O-methyltransferase [Sphingomonas xanthus]QDP18968.1 protein-L-isoaspartate(D-aspartate) O-methyltransferase [Sphingomonas xanthus]